MVDYLVGFGKEVVTVPVNLLGSTVDQGLPLIGSNSTDMLCVSTGWLEYSGGAASGGLETVAGLQA